MDMDEYRTFFAGKKVTLMGLGVLGRGAGDAVFLAECGAQVLVTDLKTEEQLQDSVAKLKKYPTVSLHLGGHVTEDFTQCDMVIKAAGVPLDSPYIKAARDAGVPVYMSTALFAKFAIERGAKIIGVTGTRGKSTVAQMIFHTLQQSGKKTLLGGNVRGVSTLALIPQVTNDMVIVLELDSWQLQGFGDLEMSPQIAVFTNFLPDHQDYYPDMDAYFADKANIFAFQKEGDTLVCGAVVEDRITAAQPPIPPVVPPSLPAEWHLHVIGEHNRNNGALAVEALRAVGLSDDDIKAGLESFDALVGRLQFVREVKGVKIYNDNNATTPEATIAALRALDEGRRNIVLIMGGADKGLDMTSLMDEMADRCKHVVFLAGSGTSILFLTQIQVFSFPISGPLESLETALHTALSMATSGDVILFSPAFASFGMFRNEYERNDQFLQVVKEV